MCFVIDNKNEKCYTADKNILCIKVVKRNYDAICVQGYNYSKFKTYYAETNFFKKRVIKKRIKCFHINNDNFTGLKTIYQGIHSYLHSVKVENITVYKYQKIIYCVIPKGTKYYYNSNSNEYVSLKLKRIKYTKFCKLKKLLMVK